MIGTLLALLVFFALFGIFLTQYVPLWMTDNESLYTSQASTSFATLKSVIDEQYALDGPQTVGTPFQVSSQGIPLIAQPTQGTLEFLPNSCPGSGGIGFFSATATGGAKGNGGLMTATHQYGQPVTPSFCVFANITEAVGPGGIPNFGQQIASGTLQMQLPNRYYSPETFYMEEDGVVQSQSSSYQVLAFPPPLNISYAGSNATITASFLQLYGNASAVVGQGSQEVYSQLRYSTLQTSNGGGTPFKFTYEIGTQYPCAWDPFLYNLVTKSGLPTTDYTLYGTFSDTNSYTLTPTYTGSCYSGIGTTTILAFSVTVNYAQVYVAGVQITMGIGVA